VDIRELLRELRRCEEEIASKFTAPADEQVLTGAFLGYVDWSIEKGFIMAELRKPLSEAVDHPAHYGGDTVYEAIKVIEAWGLTFHLGNALKYICRAGKKTERIEDLQKARWYIEREISLLQTANGERSQSVAAPFPDIESRV